MTCNFELHWYVTVCTFRTTILPQKEMIHEMLGRLKEFHMKFMAEYS